MKNIKKMMAIAVACAMVIGTLSFGSLGAFADPEPAVPESGVNHPVIVTGLDQGDIVSFYHIIEWVGSNEAGNVDGWKATSDFASKIDENLLTIILKGKAHATAEDVQKGYATEVDEEISPGLTSKIAGIIAAGITTTPAPVDDPVTVGSDKKAVLNNTKSGMYMALITPKDKDTVYNPVFVSANYTGDIPVSFAVPMSTANYSDNSAAKKSSIPLVKTFENEDDYTQDNGNTTKPDDILTFNVKTTVPVYGDVFEEPFFNIEDVMDTLELDKDSIKVKIGDTELTKTETVLKSGETLVATITQATVDGYKIEFDSDWLKAQRATSDITITYDAKVLGSTPNKNVNQEKNTVTLEYSHDASTVDGSHPGGDKEYKKDITNHYTFSIDADNLFKNQEGIGESGSELIKIGIGNDGKPVIKTSTWSNVSKDKSVEGPLAGAEFELLDKDGKEFTPAKKVVSDASGRIKFENLDAGTYKLRENKAPSGYVKDSQVHIIVITAKIVDQEVTEYYDQEGNWYPQSASGLKPYTYTTNVLESYTVKFDNANVATHTFMHTSQSPTISWVKASSSEAPASIVNRKGVELPSTGGMGTKLFYIIGLILIIGAGVLMVTRRRVDSR